MTNPAPCPKCGSLLTAEALCLDGPHYAKLSCADCGRHLRFLPRPEPETGGPPAALVDVAVALVEPVRLRGTAPQVEWASTIRAKMIAEAYRSRDLPRTVVLKTISDATWFIANRDRPGSKVRWPIEQSSKNEFEPATL